MPWRTCLFVEYVPNRGTTKTVQKAIQLLHCFTADHPMLGVSELSRQLDVPRSVVFRLLATLKEGGLLEQDSATRRYRIGLGLFELGARYTARHRWFPLALRALADLVAVTGHTGYLGILSGTEVVVLASEDGVHRVRLKVNPGERFPAYATAIGKALLARLPVQQVTDLYSGVAFAPITDRTLTSLRALLADLKRTRRRRYAWADQETFAGIRAAGVACVSPADSESFAMSISYPTPSVTRRDEERIIEALVGTGERLGRALGDPWWMTEAPPV